MTKRPQRFSAHYLYRWRKYRGLTQEQLAERVGLTYSAIGRMERRKIALTQPVLDDLATALETTRGAILDEPPPAKK